jgi:hypothetical protein
MSKKQRYAIYWKIFGFDAFFLSASIAKGTKFVAMAF